MKKKFGNVSIEFDNVLDKALYAVRSEKKKLSLKDTKFIEDTASLLGKTPDEVRQMGQDLVTKVKDQIYKQKNVTDGVVSLKEEDIPNLKEEDIPNLNEPVKEEAPITNRFQQIEADRLKE